MVQDLGFFESKLGPRLGQNLVQDFFACFPMFYSVLGVCFKSQIVCRGAQIFFGQFVRVSKKGFRIKMCTFCFCLFYVGKVKGKYEKMEKEHFKKKTRKIVFLGGCEEKWSFCKIVIFRKIGKHYLCSEGRKKRAFSLQLSVFGKWSLFVAISSDKSL